MVVFFSRGHQMACVGSSRQDVNRDERTRRSFSRRFSPSVASETTQKLSTGGAVRMLLDDATAKEALPSGVQGNNFGGMTTSITSTEGARGMTKLISTRGAGLLTFFVSSAFVLSICFGLL